MMKKMIIGSMCLIALMAASIAMALAQDSQNVNGSMTGNTISNIAEPTLQVGSAIATQPVNNLDRYGAKPVYNIEAYSMVRPGTNLSTLSRIQTQPVFNISQRRGIPAKIVYTTGQYKPMYSVNTPVNPVYNITSYPPIMAPTPIP
jgi:hypothetical protein